MNYERAKITRIKRIKTNGGKDTRRLLGGIIRKWYKNAFE